MFEEKHWNRGAMSGYFDGRNGRLLVTLEDLRWSVETGIIAVLPGNS